MHTRRKWLHEKSNGVSTSNSPFEPFQCVKKVQKRTKDEVVDNDDRSGPFDVDRKDKKVLNFCKSNKILYFLQVSDIVENMGI